MISHIALVTGSSSGLGLAFAHELAQRGYNLLMVSNEESIHSKAEEIRKRHPALYIISLVQDLSTQNAPQQLYEYTHNEGLEIEVLINNAGVYHDCDILDDSEKFTSLILNLHMYTPAMLCYLYGQDMRTKRHGYILNVCSVTSKIIAQRLATYASTKSFLSAYTRSLHIELKQYGVYVTNVSPGAVDTGLFTIRRWMTKAGKALGIIATPKMVVRRGLWALFHGRSKVTVPALFWHILTTIILCIPTWMLRLIRRLGWF